jgi:predicted 3-demethylubiquinone-9 3-methyltransferase (glyoxalase superfamily)
LTVFHDFAQSLETNTSKEAADTYLDIFTNSSIHQGSRKEEIKERNNEKTEWRERERERGE